MSFGTLIESIPCREGWFAFFFDEEAEVTSFFAEPIEAWGSYEFEYIDRTVGIEIRPLKFDPEYGILEGTFLTAVNCLGVLFSKKLRDIAESDISGHEVIARIPELVTRLEIMLQDKKNQEEIDATTVREDIENNQEE